MALACGNYPELTHQLRFLLFEIGIGLAQSSTEQLIAQAQANCLQRLQKAALAENLINQSIDSFHIHDFIDQLQTQLRFKTTSSVFYRWKLLRDELDQTIANEALALAYRQRWHQELIGETKPCSSFWKWLLARHSPQELLPFLEQWGNFVHPYHPNFHTKTGFSRREVMQYSPEFNAQVSLHWCALHRGQALTANIDYQQLIEQEFPQEFFIWREKMLFKQFNPDNFYPLPVHPWQWRNKLQHKLSSLVDNKELILFPHHQVTRPITSFHTLMPLSPKTCHLKVAMSVHTPSGNNLISPASIQDGPRLSAWVTECLKKQDYYQQSLYLARDLSGIHLHSSSIPKSEYDQMALILRENPLQAVEPATYLVPLASLFTPSPLSGKPLLSEIIHASGLLPEHYFSLYCRCVIQGQLHLLLRYGLAFNTEQHNTLIAFKDNLPKALVLKDLEAILLGEHPFYLTETRPQLHLNSTLQTPNLAELSNKFTHGNLQNNVAYWINYLVKIYGLEPVKLWRIVSDTIKHVLQNMINEIDSDIFTFQQQQLLLRPWQLPCLLLMRLNGDVPHSLPVTNPLREFNV